MNDKGTCERCGSKENYNFALNIGLCNPCIGKELEENASPECRDFEIKQLRQKVTKLSNCLSGIHVSLIALEFAIRQGGEVKLETIGELKQEIEQAHAHEEHNKFPAQLQVRDEI